MSKAGQKQLVVGLAALLLGWLVYAVDRPAGQLVIAYGIGLGKPSGLFGVIGYNLPSFAHVFAFVLLTTVLLNGGKKTAIGACLSWVFVEMVFELGQHDAYASVLSQWTPPWFAYLPILENTDDYFLYGTFDLLDLLAIALGALTAYVVIRSTERFEVNHE